MRRAMGVLTGKAIVAEIEAIHRGRFVDQSEF